MATKTTNRNPTEANSAKSAKLPAPSVARSTRAEPLPELGPPPILNANAITSGSTMSSTAVHWVRRRLSWRANSTRSGNVRPGRNWLPGRWL
jgi:hypothetical protein